MSKLSPSKGLKLNSNQYTNVVFTPEEYVDDLLSHRVDKIADECQLFTCCIPVGKGVSFNSGGYARVSFNGKRGVAHKLVHSISPFYDPELDVSHLCVRSTCCNPDHLYSEDRNVNISRRGCIGYLKVGDNWFSACPHSPPCKTSAIGRSVTPDRNT